MGDRTESPVSLVLVATPIGNLGDLSQRATEALQSADVVICEDTRRTGRLLASLGARPRRLVVANEHTEASAAAAAVRALQAGDRVVVVSDAGMPTVSDPGERIVRATVEAGFPVSVIPGPSAPVAALAVAGFPAQRYVMEGFLPRKGAERERALAEIAGEPRTVVVLESPRRLPRTLADLAKVCGSQRRAVVVRELTKLHEEVARGSLGDLMVRFAEPPKGEVVLVVDGAAPVEVDDAKIIEALTEARLAGASVKEAVALVVRRHGVARNRVYALATSAQADAVPGPNDVD